MSHEHNAMILWGILMLSILLMIGGISARVATPLFVAAALSFGFGIVAIFSIGIFVLALALIQLAPGFAFRRTDAKEHGR
jgi:hypothetical protein